MPCLAGIMVFDMNVFHKGNLQLITCFPNTLAKSHKQSFFPNFRIVVHGF
jgi:hypothetical protein